MRTTLTILFALLAMAWIGFYFVGRLLEDVEYEYFQTVEEGMVDAVNLVACAVEDDDLGAVTHRLRTLYDRAGGREFEAKIYSLVKTEVGMSAYLTDADGTVLFDSEGLAEGKDFSPYNDVIRTLRGEYGARSSRIDPDDETTSVIHVSAPINAQDGTVIGVFTLRKAQESMGQFIAESRTRIKTTAEAVVAGVSGMGILLLFWVGLPVMRLTRYAEAVAQGKRVAPPRLGPGEVRRLGTAMEKMRAELEGKNYVENYVKTLTHELKSPITAIRGAAELLEEEMPEEKRKRFLENIRSEASRSEDIIRRVLNLAEIESRHALETKEKVDFADLVQSVITEAATRAESRGVSFEFEAPDSKLIVGGDPILLKTAASNLMQNAIDFSPEGGVVRVLLEREGEGVRLAIEDSGPGVPDYALDRVFDRLFSLRDKVTGRKGSGLGLCFVREAAELHGGHAALVNLSGGVGARGVIWVPC